MDPAGDGMWMERLKIVPGAAREWTLAHNHAGLVVLPPIPVFPKTDGEQGRVVVGVAVIPWVAVRVGVPVMLAVAVDAGEVGVEVGLEVLVAVSVEVAVRVLVGVEVEVAGRVAVEVEVGVRVAVAVKAACVAVPVEVAVRVGWEGWTGPVDWLGHPKGRRKSDPSDRKPTIFRTIFPPWRHDGSMPCVDVRRGFSCASTSTVHEQFR
jgi:hypothetical protein